MKNIPLLFGEIAQQMGIVTENQIKEALDVQGFYDPPKLIGEILLEKGYITQLQIQQLLNLQKQNRQSREDEAFAIALQKLNILSEDKVEEAKTYQKSELQKGKQMTLATAMVDQKLLTIEKAKQVMKSPSYRGLLESGEEKKEEGGLETLKGYKLLEKISAGGMGIVYKALQVELERIVAVKVLNEEFQSEEYVRRFYYEAKLAAKLNHPNLIQIYDVGFDKNKYFYSMELVEGENMAVKLRGEGRFQTPMALDLIIQVAKGLDHIHGFNIVHGDVKPDNVIIRNDGIAKLMDLGLARQITVDVNEESKEIIGTPYYMSPEQISGKPMDARSDIFSLGAAFFRIITGKYPFSGQTTRAIIQAVLKKEAPLVTEIDYTIPEDISKIISRMLRKDPEKRYQRVKDVLHALDKILL